MEKFQDLYIKSLTESLSEQEMISLRSWLNLSSENRSWADDIKKSWNSLDAYSPDVQIDTEAALTRFLSGLGAFRQTAKRNRVYPLLRWAAVALVVLGLSIWFFVSSDLNQDALHIARTSDHLELLILPDNSEITLNSGSTLEYPKSFDPNVRKVSLEGEGFFRVKGKANHPFEVHTADAVVRVIGTEFNVRSFKNENTVEVQVLSGMVEVLSVDTNERITLRPGEKAILTKTNEAITKETDRSGNAISWKTNKLSFKNTPLSKVIHDIEKHYDINIEVENTDVLDCTFTSPFVAQELEVVLESLRRSFNMEMSRDGDESYTYKGGDCSVE